MNNDNLSETQVAFGQNTDGLVIQTYQSIPDQFIADLKQERFNNSQSRISNEYHRVASIPVFVADKWMREGFDIYTQPAKAILARLKLENLDYFITSDKG